MRKKNLRAATEFLTKAEKPPAAPGLGAVRCLQKAAAVSGLAMCLTAAGLAAMPPATVYARHQAEQQIESERIKRLIERERQEAEQRARETARIEARRKRRASVPPGLEESAARDESLHWDESPDEEETGDEDDWDTPDSSDAEDFDTVAVVDDEPDATADTPEETAEDDDFPEETAAATTDDAESGDVREEIADAEGETGDAETAASADEEIAAAAGGNAPGTSPPPPAGNRPAPRRTPVPVEPPPELLEPGSGPPAYGGRPRIVIRQRSTEAAAELPDNPQVPERENWDN